MQYIALKESMQGVNIIEYYNQKVTNKCRWHYTFSLIRALDGSFGKQGCVVICILIDF